MIHFLGGAFVGAAPQLAYNHFLFRLAKEGFCIITPPFIVQPDHWAIAADVTRSFQRCFGELKRDPLFHGLPVFGVGHSLGAKLQLLLSCQNVLTRHGNVLIAFNNFDSNRAIPFADFLPSILPLDFSPTPSETLREIETKYLQPQTLLFKFARDALDESHQISAILQSKFPNTFMYQRLFGDHLTPIDLTTIEMNALDSEQGVASNRQRLETLVVKWLMYQLSIYSRSIRSET